VFGTDRGIRLWSRSTSKRLSLGVLRVIDAAIQKRFKDALEKRKFDVQKHDDAVAPLGME
jgi:hypothetical protein